MLMNDDKPRSVTEQGQENNRPGDGKDSPPKNLVFGRTSSAVGEQGEAGVQSKGRPQRASAALGRGRAVIVVGHDLNLERWIDSLQEALAKARRAKTYGLELDSFLKMLADMTR